MYYTIHAELIEYKDNLGGYVDYVFKDLETHLYLVCTKLPNWQLDNIKLGDKGFVVFKEVEAGKSTWFDSKLGINNMYNYDGIYLINFIKEQSKIDKIFI